MDKFKKYFKKIIFSYRALPDKKQYVEFITATLSVPVLITAIVLNLNNIKSINKQAPPPNPTTAPIKIIMPTNDNSEKTSIKENKETEITPTPKNETECGLDTAKISSPQEGDTLTSNPVSLIISYKTGENCSLVWSHQVNNSSYSDYDDKSVSLYNLPKGKIIINVRIKSIANGDEKILTRTFNYNGSSNTEPTLTPTITPNNKSGTASAN